MTVPIEKRKHFAGWMVECVRDLAEAEACSATTLLDNLESMILVDDSMAGSSQ